MFRNYGRAAVSEFLGERIVFRNLNPADERLPRLDELRHALGLGVEAIPRKVDAEYARVIVALLRQAHKVDAPGACIRRLVFIGDTRMLDGEAFDHICRAGGWPGLAFIGAENDRPAAVDITASAGGQTLYLANRWAALPDFGDYAAAHGFPVDEETALVVDLDKTAIGARGRNGHVIDQARVQAVHLTVAGYLGAAFDPAAFQRAYEQLNQPEFHPFTADNQDYLAYICLALGGGVDSLDGLVARVRAGQLATFQQFIQAAAARRGELPAALQSVHDEIYANMQRGDPTPFKPFRRNEYLQTVARLGCVEDGAAVERMLAEEIVITQEVRALALAWRRRGALLFGLSDKPDEAVFPTAELAAQGCLPLHRVETHAVGAEVKDRQAGEQGNK
ncbi:MAG: hypothetical protein L0Z70_15775 [Chloroflexi bacterium]|nr:hypothetical protein [Chloroflexota bacterium]